jgi:hypothetical protein
MQDTIELLEAIGRDASLRHRTSAELADVLANAPAALREAAESGDGVKLALQLGKVPAEPPQSIQSPFREEEPEQEEQDVPAPDRRIPS